MRVEPGVHAIRVGIEDGARLRREDGQIALCGGAPAQRPDELVVVERPGSEQLGQSTRRDMPPDLHLPHAFLGVDVALGEEQVVRRRRADLGDAVQVPPDRRCPLQARDGDRARRLRQGPSRDPGDGADARGDRDQQDDEHGDDHVPGPHGQPGSRVPRPAASARRTIASANTTSARPTPRCVTTTRPLAGRIVPSRIASPSVAVGSG